MRGTTSKPYMAHELARGLLPLRPVGGVGAQRRLLRVHTRDDRL
jgi:hypothetical protein